MPFEVAAHESVESLSWPPTDLDAVCLPKALPVAVLDDLEKATKERQRGRGERKSWGREGGRESALRRGRGAKEGIHLIKMENVRQARRNFRKARAALFMARLETTFLTLRN